MVPARSRRVLSVVLAPLVTLATAGIVLVAGATPASAAVFTVGFPTDRDLNVCGFPAPAIPSPLSLREALCLGAQTPGSNVVQVPAGTYQLTLGDIDLAPAGLGTGASSLQILGAGASATQIVGDVDGERVLEIFGPASGSLDVTLSSVTLRGGRSYDSQGGGLRVNGGATGTTLNVSVEDSVVSGNSSAEGAPPGGQPGFGGNGGGIFALGANLTLTRTTVTNNSAGQNSGGGLAFNAGALTITESTFSNNRVTTGGFIAGGGAMFLGSATTASINRSAFTGNQADGAGTMAGGAIESFASALSVNRSTFTGNSSQAASGSGGAIAVQAGVAALGYNRIVSNLASSGGSGVAQLGTAVVTAENNWWGCNAGPGASGCQTTLGTVDADPRLTLTHTASPSSILVGESSTLTASMRTNSAGTALDAADFNAFTGVPVSFGNPVRGVVLGAGTTLNSGGTATAEFTGTSAGAGSATATVDGQSATAVVSVSGEYAPIITTQPSDETVTEGGSVAFNARADGLPLPSVQWEVSTDGGATWLPIQGQTSTTLNVNTTEGMDGYQYRAVFTNSRGSATTTAATLTVVPTPRPTVGVEQALGQADPSSTSPIAFTATFSEDVTGFAADDVVLSSSTAGGTLQAAVTGGPSVYTISVTGMTTHGDVIVSVPEGAATGSTSGKTNVASTSVDNRVEWTPPPKTPQTITFAALDLKTFGDAPFALTASSDSGLPITYSVDPDDDECSVSGSTVTILHGGTCSITASQPGDDTYAAATPVTRVLTIRPKFESLRISVSSTLAYNQTAVVEVRAHTSTPAGVVVTAETPTLCSISSGRFIVVQALAGSGTCELSATAPATRDFVYSSGFARITLTKASQSISFGALADRTFGEPDFTVSASASSQLPVSFAASGDCTVSSSGLVHLTAAGSCTITASQEGNDNYNAATPVSRTFTISPAFTLTAPDDVQYSDELTLEADVAGSIAGTVEFEVDGAEFCTATIDTATGDASCSAVVSLPADTYDVDATLVPDSASFGGSTASSQVTVNAEDAATEYTGETFVSTGSATATTANVPLRALVTQASDGSLGDITKANVEFQLFRSGNFTATPNYRVPAVVGADGVATATASALPVDNYVVRVALLGTTPQYFAGPLSESVVLTVYAPTSGVWATGGGWVTDPGTNNLPVAINPDNDRGSLGFSVRYKKGSTTPQGQSVYVFRGADGNDYVVKSNSWRGGGAAFRSTTSGGTASFSGRASVQVFDPRTGLLVSGLGGGNFTYRVDVTDSGKSDSYAITVYGAQNRIYHQAGTPSAQLALQGGNITVHAK